MLKSIVQFITGIVSLRGDTDNTIIGNIEDSIKVHATSSTTEWDYYISKGYGFCVKTNANDIPVGTTEKAIFLIKNNGSKTMYIPNISLFQDPTNSNNWLVFTLYYNPTVTSNGTAKSNVNLKAGSGITSSANAYINPTVSSNGTAIKSWVSGYGHSAFIVTDEDLNYYKVLPPGQSLLVTAKAKSNGTNSYLNIQWFEV